MEPRFLFPHGARGLLNKVKSHCQVCAACNPANYSLAGDQQWTLIPDRPMESVSIDVFSMPEVKVGKDTYDCVVIVVDCYPGYLAAVLAKKKGLTAKEVAEKMIKHWLTILTSPRRFAATTPRSSRVDGSRPCVLSWVYGVPRPLRTLAVPMAEPKWPVPRFLRACASFT